MKLAAIILAITAALGIVVALVARLTVPTFDSVDVTDPMSTGAALAIIGIASEHQPWIMGGTLLAVVSLVGLLIVGAIALGHRLARR
jgi:hypothetical protein